MGCVYLITCLSTGKYYVGKTVKTAQRRWMEHRANVRHGTLVCPRLHRAILKYGEASFAIETLVESVDKQALVELEKLWIVALDSQNRNVGLNLTSGGDGAPNPSPARRERMRQLMVGNTFRIGIEPYNKGIPHSTAQIKKLKANYWEKRATAEAVKEMLRQQAGNRKGKCKPVPAFRICNLCHKNKTHGNEYRCNICNAQRVATRRAEKRIYVQGNIGG